MDSGILGTLALLAQEIELDTSTQGMLFRHSLSAIVFSAVGVVVLGVSFWIISKASPFPLRKEIEEDHNSAVAIIIGALIIGMAIIIASAIHG